MTFAEVATIAAGLAGALIVGIFSYIGVRNTIRDRATRAEQTREEEAQRVVRKYRDPIIRSAFDLQSRLYNIIENSFLKRYLVDGTPAEQDYARQSTLYVVAEYFCWVEVLNREAQFLDLRDVARNRVVAEKLESIRWFFAAATLSPPFRLFRAEQRAIGEIVLVATPGGGRESIGYATFVQKLTNPGFAKWFDKLSGDLDVLAQDPGQNGDRIAAIQGALIDLIDALDPRGQYFAPERRRKLVFARAASSKSDGEGD